MWLEGLLKEILNTVYVSTIYSQNIITSINDTFIKCNVTVLNHINLNQISTAAVSMLCMQDNCMCLNPKSKVAISQNLNFMSLNCKLQVNIELTWMTVQSLWHSRDEKHADWWTLSYCLIALISVLTPPSAGSTGLSLLPSFLCPFILYPRFSASLIFHFSLRCYHLTLSTLSCVISLNCTVKREKERNWGRWSRQKNKYGFWKGF